MHRPFALVVAALSPGLFAQSLPHVPAIPRDVTNVIDFGTPPATNAQFQRPHIPALRTTADGRIALIVEGGPSEAPGFTLMTPEKLTAPVLLNPAGSYTVSKPGFFPLPLALLTTGGKPVSHLCLWDPNPPVNQAGQDRYDLFVFCTSNYQTSPRRTQFFVTPVTILVSNPKTATAAIASITPGTAVAGTAFPYEASGFEPVIVGDGRLLIVRIFSSELPWTPNPTGKISADIVYSYYTAAEGGPADVTKWTELLPITHAPFDSRIKTTFGFARQQFRDAEGNPIPDGEDIGGSYPWMDRAAKNLFLEGVNDTLRWGTLDTQSRYPQAQAPGDLWYASSFNEDNGHHQGVSLIGLWSRGKMVQLDTLNNDMDYAIGTGDGAVGPQQRMVTLFQPNTGPAGNEPGTLRLGYGRSTVRMPLGENDNANIIDSLENHFNYRNFMRPLTLRDVVWHVNNSKHTDEFVFDDYLDPDAVIVAHMNGLMTFPSFAGQDYNFLQHQSGWNSANHTFSLPVKLQNGATAVAADWLMPPHGLVVGGGRLEPAATGGIHGKGFWMNGTTGIRFTMPANAPTKIASRDWYFGLFVDCRFADDTTERRLLTFPDGTSVRLYGRRQVVYADATGQVVHRITVPSALPPSGSQLDDLLPQLGWAHLAFQVSAGGKQVDFLLNGLPFSRWQHFTTTLFQPIAGDLTVGQISGTTGFTGWVDEFKLIAHAVDPETACNHAGGTLIGLPAGYTGEWKTKLADRHPTWAHGQITTALQHRGEATYPQYACFRTYRTDNGTHWQSIPVGTVHLRQSVHFSEGPLFHNAPRPDTRGNAFCVSCHNATGVAGLNVGALAFNGILAVDDPRRQPSQPPAKLFANIPANLVENGTATQPPTRMVAPVTGQPIDPWLLPSYGGSASVNSFSLLHGTTGAELGLLTFGAQVDPAKLGTNNFRLRANLDSAQGSVAMSLAGQTANPAFAPYIVPATGVTLSPGLHQASAAPTGVTGTILQFTLVGNTKRTVANYRNDFQLGAPKVDWLYAWNANGQLTASNNSSVLRQLNWYPGTTGYTELGLAYPESSALMAAGRLGTTTGHPGRGTGQGAVFDRFVLAGYQAKITGFYGIDACVIKSVSAASNGGQISIYTQIGTTMTRRANRIYTGGATATINNLSLGSLPAGAVIWIGVGPNGNDTSDAFEIDFNVAYNELFF